MSGEHAADGSAGGGAIPALSRADVALVVQARAENVALVRQAMTGAGEGAGIPATQIEDIALAVSEAATNVVLHAYRGREPGLLEAGLWLDSGRISIVVRDYGGGVAPRPDSPGLGLGLPIISSLARGVQITTADDGANEIRMRFDVPDVATPAR